MSDAEKETLPEYDWRSETEDVPCVGCPDSSFLCPVCDKPNPLADRADERHSIWKMLEKTKNKQWLKTVSPTELPPLGIMPRYVWELKRMKAICLAINRALDSSSPIRIEWIEEYNELCRREKKAKMIPNDTCTSLKQ